MRDGHNQLLMIREDILSHDYNIQERIAEKEYYEELLHTYANQYEAEAELVLALAQDNIQI